MAHTLFTCTLTTADQPACTSYARVTITDSGGDTARGCPRHAVAALDGITGARVDWADSRELKRARAPGPGAVRGAPPARGRPPVSAAVMTSRDGRRRPDDVEAASCYVMDFRHSMAPAATAAPSATSRTG